MAWQQAADPAGGGDDRIDRQQVQVGQHPHGQRRGAGPEPVGGAGDLDARQQA